MASPALHLTVAPTLLTHLHSEQTVLNESNTESERLYLLTGVVGVAQPSHVRALGLLRADAQQHDHLQAMLDALPLGVQVLGWANLVNSAAKQETSAWKSSEAQASWTAAKAWTNEEVRVVLTLDKGDAEDDGEAVLRAWRAELPDVAVDVHEASRDEDGLVVARLQVARTCFVEAMDKLDEALQREVDDLASVEDVTLVLDLGRERMPMVVRAAAVRGEDVGDAEVKPLRGAVPANNVAALDEAFPAGRVMEVHRFVSPRAETACPVVTVEEGVQRAAKFTLVADALVYACEGDSTRHVLSLLLESLSLQASALADLLMGCFVRSSYSRSGRCSALDSRVAGLTPIARVGNSARPAFALTTRSIHVDTQCQAHALTLRYPVAPMDEVADFESFRRTIHQVFALPSDRPLVRLSNAMPLGGGSGGGESSENDGGMPVRLADVHEAVKAPTVKGGKDSVEVAMIDGHYKYYHYMQDSFNDDGWGCAYRTFQTQCSWLQMQGYASRDPPSHREIQEALVDLGDKPASLIGSREWIGSFELVKLMQHLYGVQARTVFMPAGGEPPVKELLKHFREQGSPVMIGGGQYAYGLLGVAHNSETGDSEFLILDPHYTGSDSVSGIIGGGWCRWRKPKGLFLDTHFYNFACPVRPQCI